MANYTFHNPSGSAYFVHELIPRKTDGFFPSSSAQIAYFSGSTYSNLTSSVTNPIVAYWTGSVINGIGSASGGFSWGMVIPEGTSSVDFNPGITIPISESIFRGTGEFTLILTT